MSETTLSSHIGTITDEDTRVRIEEKGLAATATTFVSEALRYAGEKSGIGSSEAAAAQLTEGGADILGYFQYQLAVQVGQHVGTLDRHVKAVYLHDHSADAEESLGALSPDRLIHLVVWAEPKTDALASLLMALDRALISRVAVAIGAPDLSHLLATKVVSDDDVWSPSGYSALLRSLHQKPICVWPR